MDARVSDIHLVSCFVTMDVGSNVSAGSALVAPSDTGASQQAEWVSVYFSGALSQAGAGISTMLSNPPTRLVARTSGLSQECTVVVGIFVGENHS